MIANKVYSCAEMREERIYTGDYRFIDKEGEYIATLSRSRFRNAPPILPAGKRK